MPEINMLMVKCFNISGFLLVYSMKYVYSVFVCVCVGLCGFMASVWDCDIVVSSNSSCYYIHFQTNTLEKDINVLIPLLPKAGI